MQKVSSHTFLLAKGYHRTVASGCQGGAVFQEIRPGAGFKTGGFVREKLGGRGSNVERLLTPRCHKLSCCFMS